MMQTLLQREYHILDLRLRLTAPPELVRDFDLLYSRFATPCPCPVCAGEEQHEVHISVEPLEDGRLRFDSTWGRADAAAGDGMPYLFFLIQNHLIRASRRFFAIHAGSVAIDGRGCLLAAPSSVGKSTLTLALAARGAAFLSDEIAAVPRGRALLHGFARAPGLRAPSLPLLGLGEEAICGRLRLTDEEKVVIAPEAVPAQERMGAIRPELVVFLVPPPDPDVAQGLEYLELTFNTAPGPAFLDEIRGIEGVSWAVLLSDRAAPVLRIGFRPGARLVEAVEAAAARSGVFIAGHYRGCSLPMDYARAPEVRAVGSRSGLKRLLAHVLNARGLAAAEGPARLFMELSRLFAATRFYEMIPGELHATAEAVEHLASLSG